MKLLLIVASIISLSGCSGEDSSPNTITDTPDTPVIIEFHKVLYPSVAEGVSFSDVTSLSYNLPTERVSYGEDSLQFADYWSPSAESEREDLPELVFIHGGCWLNSFRSNQSYPLASALALNGFGVWSIEYRATGDTGGAWPGTYEDIEAALAQIESKRKAMSKQGEMIVIGHSAGGHLALLASANMDIDFDVIGLAAIVNIADYANGNSPCSGAAVSFMNGSPTTIPDQYDIANPNLNSLAGTGYLFVGGQDNIVSKTQAQNSSLSFRVNQNAGHFDWIHPGTHSFSNLLAYLVNQ